MENNLIQQPVDFKDSGYSYIKSFGNREHLLLEKSTGYVELWISRAFPNAGYCIKWRKSYLEFVRGVDIIK
jgi:hypothetical protein